MTVVFDMHDGLIRALRGRSEAWDFLRGFAAHWARPLGPQDGWNAEAVAEAEHRLGVALPAALREAYLLFGRRADLTSNHDTLLGPDELYVSDGALVYQVENQGCAFWGVALEDLARADPGTLIRPDLADKTRERWEPWEPSLSTACVAMVMSETVLAEDGFTDHGEVADDEFALTEVELLRQLPGVGRELRWFSGPDVLVREVEGGILDVRARTEEALDAVREAIPADWLDG
jgi:hypothetical protein